MERVVKLPHGVKFSPYAVGVVREKNTTAVRKAFFMLKEEKSHIVIDQAFYVWIFGVGIDVAKDSIQLDEVILESFTLVMEGDVQVESEKRFDDWAFSLGLNKDGRVYRALDVGAFSLGLNKDESVHRALIDEVPKKDFLTVFLKEEVRNTLDKTHTDLINKYEALKVHKTSFGFIWVEGRTPINMNNVIQFDVANHDRKAINFLGLNNIYTCWNFQNADDCNLVNNQIKRL